MKPNRIARIFVTCVAFSLLAMPVSAKSKQKLTPEELAAVATTVTGKLVYTATITLSSTFPAADVISCTGDAILLDLGSGSEIIETASVAATRSGTTATCTATIPYSWSLVTPTTDMVSVNFNINVPATPSTPAALLPNRVSSRGLGSIKVPANGTTTTFTVKATI